MTFCVKLTGGKKEKEKKKRPPEADAPQLPQKCIHSPYVLQKQHYSNSNTTPFLSRLHCYSPLLVFHFVPADLSVLIVLLFSSMLSQRPWCAAGSSQAAAAGIAEMV